MSKDGEFLLGDDEAKLIILLNYNGRKNEIDADDDFGKWKGTMPEIESY